MNMRKMEPGDCLSVCDLERCIFPDAWSEASVESTIRQPGGIAFVLEETEEGPARILGYFLGMQILDEAEIHRIAVAEEERGRGLGQKLMDHFLALCREQGASAQTLEVRAGNLPAIRLYEKNGFVTEGRRKNYYRDPSEDALIMWRREESC